MYVDPSGEFGILATLLICTVVGGLISGGIEMGGQLISTFVPYKIIDDTLLSY